MMVMLYQAIVTASLLASINAVPLNINLGAYSPALVVGDGEISFGGGQDVSELMNTLEGAAVDAAVESSGEEGQARDVGVSKASVDEEAAPALESDGAPAASGTLDPNLADQAAQIAAIRGVGSKAKELDPRNPTITSAPQKRDLAGFDRALEYAEAALTKGPLIQLGTGEGGSGVGIIVDNTGGRVGEGVAEEAPGVGGGEAVEKRGNDDVVAQQQPQRRAKVTTMYIRRGMSEGLSTRLQDRGVETAPVMNIPSIRRGRSKRNDDNNNEAIDSINLNVEGDEGVTMTFVESDDEDADEEGAA